MLPVDMTLFGVRRYPFAPGNCLSACVASILEMPIEEVPLFVDRHDPSVITQADGIFWAPHDYFWTKRLDAWLAKHGLQAKYFDPCDPEVAPDFHILYGYSVLGNEHAVVGHAGRVVHDPHPSRTGLAYVTGVICIEPYFG